MEIIEDILKESIENAKKLNPKVFLLSDTWKWKDKEQTTMVDNKKVIKFKSRMEAAGREFATVGERFNYIICKTKNKNDSIGHKMEFIEALNEGKEIDYM